MVLADTQRSVSGAKYSIGISRLQFQSFPTKYRMQFKIFLESREQDINSEDLEATLKKIPKAHRKLLKPYKYTCQSGNTLKGDDGHIGVNDLNKKKITVAAPWNYGREFAFLHEIGHTVWANYVAPCDKKVSDWTKIAKATKGTTEKDIEELFCHAYANTYAKHKIEAHTHAAWEKFVKSL